MFSRPFFFKFSFLKRATSTRNITVEKCFRVTRSIGIPVMLKLDVSLALARRLRQTACPLNVAKNFLTVGDRNRSVYARRNIRTRLLRDGEKSENFPPGSFEKQRREGVRHVLRGHHVLQLNRKLKKKSWLRSWRNRPVVGGLSRLLSWRRLKSTVFFYDVCETSHSALIFFSLFFITYRQHRTHA